MLNLRTREWEDQRGEVWQLKDLVQPHLENIQRLLRDVIDGRRERPNGCYQSIYELRASLVIINKEVERRKMLGIDTYVPKSEPLPKPIVLPVLIGSKVVEITISFKLR
jgi:hypothetical protein